MAGLRRTHSVVGSSGFRSKEYQQGCSRSAGMADRWGAEDKYTDGESQTLTQLSSQRTQPMAQSNHFENILATQRHGEIISHLKQFLSMMSESNSNQSVTTSECQERLDLVFEAMAKFSVDARRQEISHQDQLRQLEREVLNARREMKEMSELLRNLYTDNTKRKEADAIQKFCEPVYARSSIHDPDEGICVADYLSEVRQKRLRLDEINNATHKRSQLGKQTGLRSAEGSDGYDDLFNEKGDSYRKISDDNQQMELYRNQIPRGFADAVKSANNSYEPTIQHMRTDWLRSERETTIVAVSNYQHNNPQRSSGSSTLRTRSGLLVKPAKNRENKPVQWGWDRKDNAELEIEVTGIKRAREKLQNSGRDVRAKIPQPLQSSLDDCSIRQNYGQASYTRSFKFDDGKTESYARNSLGGIPQQTPVSSYIRS